MNINRHNRPIGHIMPIMPIEPMMPIKPKTNNNNETTAPNIPYALSAAVALYGSEG